ncbi:MAG: phosphoribulokinase [Gemmatimonadaceae bacterium]
MTRSRPIILGIVGDSAAGKTTLTAGLVNILGPDRVTHVCTDDYHKYDRQERAKLGITALHPDCNYVDVLELHLERLYYGEPILKPFYDHATGSLVRPEYVKPREFVIVEGLLGFSTPVLRQFYDVKVFLDPPEELRRQWKVKRDTTKRGYTTEQVLDELDKREPDSRDFIRPQRQYADVVARFHPPEGTTEPPPDLDVQLVLRPTIPHPDLSYLFADGRDVSREAIRLELGRDDGRPADFLCIDGRVSAAHAHELEDAIWHHMPDLRPLREDQFGEYFDRSAVRHSSQLALTQLLLSYHLLRRYRDVGQLPLAAPVSLLRRIESSARPLTWGTTAERAVSASSH